MLAALVNRKPAASIALLLLVLAVFSFVKTQQRLKDAYWHVVTGSDPQWYYSYLPATFIYGFEDHPLSFEHQGFNKYPGTNLLAIRYTSGIAIMELPFFLVAHGIASAFGMQADGYTKPYGLAVVLAALFYALLGMLLLFKTLCRHFPPWAALVTVAMLFLGTNLGHYTYTESGMSHAFSFCLFSAFAFLTPRLLSTPNWKNIGLMSAILGLAVLIRPTNIVLALYLLGYQVYSRADLMQRVKLLLAQWKFLPLAGGIVLLIMAPQMAYWHAITGDWIHWSYGEEGFDNWNAPKLYSVLFSVQNGLFIYAPVILLAFIGLFWTSARKLLSGPVLMLIFALATYTFASWWAWWFGGAFGHRCYVEFFALLAFPLAFMIHKMLSCKRQWVQVASTVFLICCAFYTTGLATAYSPPWDGPGWTWETFYERGIKQLF